MVNDHQVERRNLRMTVARRHHCACIWSINLRPNANFVSMHAHGPADRFDACPLNVQTRCAPGGLTIFRRGTSVCKKITTCKKFQRDPTLVLWKADPNAHICSLTMVKADVADFICPGCQARYKIVRAKSAARSHDLPLHCKVCKQPLAATDGEDILKYFLIRRPKGDALAG